MDEALYQNVLCRLHLRAILPTLCELTKAVPEARSIAASQNLQLKIGRWGGPFIWVSLSEGEVSCPEHGHRRIPLSLRFFSDRQINALFQKKGIPIPMVTGAFWQLPKLRAFQKLLELLEAYLNPPHERFQDRDFVKIHLHLLFSMLMRALKEVVENDPEAQKVMLETPSGLAEFQIPTIAFKGWIYWNQKVQGIATGLDKPPREADAFIVFRDENIALASIQNTLDPLAAIGLGQIAIRGLIPLAEGLSFSMDRISTYLVPS